MLNSEHKNTAFMKTLVYKYCQPGDHVYDPFSGSYATACALMLHYYISVAFMDIGMVISPSMQ